MKKGRGMTLKQLQRLREQKLVICIRKGRLKHLFELTEKGERYLKEAPEEGEE